MKYTFKNTIEVFVFKFWQAVSGLLVLVFTSKFITPNEQGYYFTLISMASLSMLFELGLSVVLTTAAAHKFVGLSWSDSGKIEGGDPSGFIGLARYAAKWYLGALLLSLIVLFPLGGWYISSAALDEHVNWLGPWALLMIGSSIALLFNPLLAIVEGTGKIYEAYLVRFLQSFVGVGAALLFLYFDGGLYAAAMPAIGMAAVGILWATVEKREFLIQIAREYRGGLAVNKNLFGFQWRAAISWLAGYIMVLMYVPLLFKTQGPVASGKMALTMNVVNTMAVLAGAWLTSRLPLITTYIAEKKWYQADLVFRRAFYVSVSLYLLGGISILLFRFMLSYTEYDERVLPFFELLVLYIGMGFYHASGLLASYLRTYLKEPTAKVSLIAAVMMGFIAVYIAPRWGSCGIVWLIFFVNMLFLFPCTAYLYKKLRRDWQSE